MLWPHTRQIFSSTQLFRGIKVCILISMERGECLVAAYLAQEQRTGHVKIQHVSSHLPKTSAIHNLTLYTQEPLRILSIMVGSDDFYLICMVLFS